MNLRNRIIATVGATALLATTALTGVAVDSDSVDVEVGEITGGQAFTVVISEAVDFTAVDYSFSDQMTHGSLQLQLTDTRGNDNGWNVQLNASDFIGVDGLEGGSGNGDTIPVLNNFSLTDPTISAIAPAASQPTTGQSAHMPFAVLNADQEIWDAEVGSGAGYFTLDMNTNLNVPGGTLVDRYRTTITVSIASGPGN